MNMNEIVSRAATRSKNHFLPRSSTALYFSYSHWNYTGCCINNFVLHPSHL